MTCYPHAGKGAAKRRLMDTLALIGRGADGQAVTITATGVSQGRLRLAGTEVVIAAATLAEAATDGYVDVERGNPGRITLTAAGITAIEVHEEAHRAADAKAREAAASAAGPRAATDAGDLGKVERAAVDAAEESFAANRARG